jgi:ATP-dependent Clp protease ATP-binding subunit ClpX
LKIIEGCTAAVPPKGGRKHPQQDFLQIDTTHILFVCGGAFHGLESIIERRVRAKTMGFGAEIQSKVERKIGDILGLVEPQDLLKYGLIPEFIGRLPVIATLDDLTEEDLVKILTQPRNAITRQYQRLFDLDGVALRFAPDALQSVAREAIHKGTGARGLRAILEQRMLDIMYTIPTLEDVKECIVNREVILKKAEPILVFEKQQETA